MAQILSQGLAKLGLSKKALLLGSGFVTKPAVQFLSDDGVQVTVACRTLENAQGLIKGIANTRAISLDVNDEKALDEAVGAVDLVISLIPYTYHAQVIKSAIRQKKNVVTTSYVSPAMLNLEQEAKDAGITVMNEIGLDPGIDHLYAVKTITEVHEAGGKIKGFYSYCGGLPSPEDSGNPLGYKFSWSPRGVLLALGNTAKFWKDGKITEIPGTELMGSAKPYFITPGFNFVAYPNRDSTVFKERYSIPEADSVIRGTLRYAVFPAVIKVLRDTGFLSEEKQDFLDLEKITGAPPKWVDATKQVLGATSSSETDLVWAILSKTSFADNEEKDRIIDGLRWCGLFSDEPITPRGTPLDTLCATLQAKMGYDDGERDFVMLQHKFEIENKDGSTQTVTSTLAEYGEPTTATSTSAMAKLVGVPCGVACRMVLDGTISEKGILAPLDPKISEPIRIELQKYGIEMKEKVIASSKR